MIRQLANADTAIRKYLTVAGSTVGERWRIFRGYIRPLLSATPMIGAAVLFGLLITLIEISSGLQLLTLLVTGAVLMAAILVLYSGVLGRARAIGFYLLIVSFTIEAMFRRRGLTETGLDAQTLFKLMIWGGACLIGAANFEEIKRALKSSRGLVWILLFALWALLSTMFSVTPTYTFGGGFAFVSLIFFVTLAVRKNGLTSCTMPIIYACGLLTISAVILYFIAPGMVVALTEGGNIPRLAGLTGSPNNLGRTASIALFFIYFAVRTKQVSPWRLDIAAIIASSGACLILSWSRTSLIALVLSIGVLKLRKHILLSVWGMAVSSAVLLALLFVDCNWDGLVRIVSRRGSLQELVTFTGRTAIWEFIWSKFLHQPLIGYGYGSTKLLMPLEFRTALGWTSTSAHNMLLQTLVTTGLIGAFLITMVLLVQARDFYKRPHEVADALFVFVLISGLFEPGAVGLSPNLLTIVWLISLAIPRESNEGVASLREKAVVHAY